MSAALASTSRPSGLRVAAAFAAVYVLWGSTYLAIKFALDSLPPFWMASSRFLIAGTLLYAWARRRGAPAPTRVHWRSALIVGGLLLMGGNGGVVWAEQRVPSGLAALLVATVPLWMVMLDGAGRGWRRPPVQVLLGIGLGLAGVALLVGPGKFAGGHGVDPLGAGALLLGALCWATGSLYSRRAPLPASPLLGTAMEMLGGGACLAIAGLVSGEWGRLDLAAATPRSLLAVGYLVVFGSLVGFTAYVWLLRVSTPPLVATYAYVNPVVAVFLGWAFAGEPVTARTLAAAAVIVGAVVLITMHRARPQAVVVEVKPQAEVEDSGVRARAMALRTASEHETEEEDVAVLVG
ncbi:MAG TPA: drug/metabolite exporter YedA [Thermoanaerobaculia bacterium]|nr:drug/metabolite exporter YedA [Thermoanaerobaculia bacterium]